MVLNLCPPGIVRDSLRPLKALMGNFEIKDHGVFKLFKEMI